MQHVIGNDHDELRHSSQKDGKLPSQRTTQTNIISHINVQQTESTMKSTVSFILFLLSALASGTSASVFLPKTMEVKTGARTFHPSSSAAASSKYDLRLALRQRRASKSTAMAILGYGVAEQVFVGGFSNFLSIVSNLSTSSWYNCAVVCWVCTWTLGIFCD